MFRKFSSILICFVVFSSLALVFCQSQEDRARAYYFIAEGEYESGKYKDAIGHARDGIEVLGNSNARLQSMLAKCYYELKEYKQAQDELTLFFEISPNDTDLYKEMLMLLISVEDIIENTVWIKCSQCNGQGEITETTTKKCEKCNGEGSIFKNCGDCQGKGRIKYYCDECSNGKIKCNHCTNGKMIEVDFNGNMKYKTCTTCRGRQRIDCYSCDGDGHWYKYCRGCYGDLGESYTCSTCSGKGSIVESYSYSCSRCSGKGEVFEYQKN